MANFEIGQKLGGYEVVGILGQGGMGTVYRVNQVSMDREVALKVLDPKLAAKDIKFSKQFIDEARAAGRLNHPNIIGVHDVSNCEINGVTIYYFSMEIVEGEDFKGIIERDGNIPLPMVEQVAIKITDALKYAEQMGIVHRDIKPENIMITKDGLIKLADLGLALQLDEDDSTNNGTSSSLESNNGTSEKDGKIKVMGTPRYMSPEQCRGKAVDSRTDQYLLGGTLFHMITGHAPYEGLGRKDLMRAQVLEEVPDPTQHMPISEPWRLLLMRMLAKKPDDRIANAEQVHEAVKMAVNGEIFNSSKRGRRQVTNGAQKQSSQLALYAIVAVVIVVIAIVIMNSGGTAAASTDSTTNTHTLSPKERELKQLQEFIKNVSPAANGSIEEIAFAVNKISGHQKFNDDSAAGKLLRTAVITLEKQQGDIQTARYNALITEIKSADHKQKVNRFQEAVSILNGITQAERDIVTTEWDSAWSALNKDIDSNINKYVSNIARATSSNEIESLIKECKLKTLYELRKKRIEEAASKRRSTLTAESGKNNKRNQAIRLKQDVNTWKNMTTHLSRHRASTEFKGFIDTATKAAKKLHDSKLQSAAKAYADIGRRMQSIDKILKSYLDKNKPSFQLNGKNARCTGLDDNNYLITLTSSNKKSLHKRDDVRIPIEKFLNSALKTSNANQRKNYTAMYLFYWQHPFFSRYSNPLPKVGASFPHLKIVRLADPSQADNYSVDFSDSALWQTYFHGENISFNRGRLNWFTKKGITGSLGKDPENKIGFSMLTFKPALKGAVRIDSKLRIHSGSFILVGVKRRNKFVRFAFNNINDIIGAIATNAAGKAEMYPRSGPMAGKKVMKKDLRLSIEIDKQGAVVFKLNNKTLTELDPHNSSFDFNIGNSGDLQFIIQGCKIGSNNSACDIIELRVKQNR